ncbi:neuronal acetylcholine receptor subunit alpha-7-like [Watersipora subatra]|uniref:neuronal acetylcholine receptor subunit alpha-7-like n=1 Tax=Watersipora subatra TaxID=2589382 RepID=UPI00355C521D
MVSDTRIDGVHAQSEPGRYLRVKVLKSWVWGGPHEVRLIRHLLKDYVSQERPALDDHKPLEVEFEITLRSIIDVDEKNQMINTNLWLYYQWVDYKLAWNPEDYGNVTEIRLPEKLIWKPDVLMYNSADPAFDGSYPVNAVLRHTGLLSQNPPGIFTSACPIAIKWFPFDDQLCDLKFGSWTYDGTKIDLKIKDGATSASLDGYSRSGEWDLLGVPGVVHAVYYDGFPDQPFVDITYTIQIRRRKLSYIVNIVIPCLMLAALTLVTFTIPPEAGEKISFGVTILLSLTVFLLMVAEELPANSDAVPLIALYFTSVMFLNAASVVFTVLVLSYHHRTSETHTMPKWIKKIVCEWLAWILRMDRPGHKWDAQSWCRKHRVEEVALIESNKSRLLQDFDEQTTPRLSIKQHCRLNGTGNLQERVNGTSSDPACHPRCEARMRAIHKDIRYITNKLKNEEEDSQITSDWKFASAVFNRLLFWFFSLATVLATVVILLGAPNLLSNAETLP